MKTRFFSPIALLVTGLFLIVHCSPAAQPFSTDITPKSVLDVMQRVADWQLAHPTTNRPTGWIAAVGDVGLMTLAQVSGDPKYREAMRAKAETNGWKLPAYQGRMYHADDQCIGQVYAELYSAYREPKMIAPLRERFDFILAHPSTAPGLDFTLPHGKSQELWSWCDALFMAPTTWLQLYAATDDKRYLDFALTNFWRTTDFLYDRNEHLYFRDSTFFQQTETNGQKVFWSRGNGWVFAGIVRLLQSLPTNHPDRPRLEKLFTDMADKVVSLQSPDGLWRASLLDPQNFPMPEASGSAMFTYGLAWGVNQGLLDRAKFEPAVQKAWLALADCVNVEGKLTHVQPAGDRPVKFAAEATAPYGGGVFLLAGSEMYRLVVLNRSHNIYAPQSIFGAPAYWYAKVRVTNPSAFRRESETLELTATNVILFGTQTNLAVMDGMSAHILDSQVYLADNNTNLLFQVDLAPHETRTFYILDASVLAAVPAPLVKTFARFVPERHDDFAWESDRIAHRAYGLALIKAEHTISSAPDVWIKRDRELIVDTMYRLKRYHEDNGSFVDNFRVGSSRGCGGLGIWDGHKLYNSSNYHGWKLITTGPIRSEFELTYDAWDAGNGRQVSETKRYKIDAGSWFTQAQSTFASVDKSPLTIGVGLAECACGPDDEELIGQDQAEGWLSYWQPEDHPKGITAIAIVLPKDSVSAFTNDAPNLAEAKIHAVVPQPTHEGLPPIRDLLAISQAKIGQPFEYYFGASWNRSGDFTNHLQWENYVKRFAERRDQPLQVTVGN